MNQTLDDTLNYSLESTLKMKMIKEWSSIKLFPLGPLVSQKVYNSRDNDNDHHAFQSKEEKCYGREKYLLLVGKGVGDRVACFANFEHYTWIQCWSQ